MKVFISWSGEQSKEIAEVFRKWLPLVLQATEPFMSSEDVRKGSHWPTRIGTELRDSKVGLLILVGGNMTAPWLVFEAGALSKHFPDASIASVLFDLNPGQIPSPLNLFQATVFNQPEMKQLMLGINEKLASPLNHERFEHAFGMNWPQLEREIGNILSRAQSSTRTERRPIEEMVEEVLEHVRSISRANDRGEQAKLVPQDPEERVVVASREYKSGRLAEITRSADGMKHLRISLDGMTFADMGTTPKLEHARRVADLDAVAAGEDLNNSKGWIIFKQVGGSVRIDGGGN